MRNLTKVVLVTLVAIPVLLLLLTLPGCGTVRPAKAAVQGGEASMTSQAVDRRPVTSSMVIEAEVVAPTVTVEVIVP